LRTATAASSTGPIPAARSGIEGTRFYVAKMLSAGAIRFNISASRSAACAAPARSIFAVQNMLALAHRRSDIAAVDGSDISGGFQRQCLVQEGLRDVFGGHFAAKQIAGHVIFLAYAARFGA
jgi:hypothetical protein